MRSLIVLAVVAWKVSAWEAVANLLDHVAAEPGVDPALRAHAAHGAVHARRRTGEHGGDDPRLLASIDRFLALAAAERSDRVAVARFVRGNLYRRNQEYERAISDFTYVVENAREHEVGLHAVNLLLDVYFVTERHAELVALARRLRGDVALAARDEDLSERLLHIDVIGTRREAEQLEQQARASGDRAAYVACGERYDRSRLLAVDRHRDDELLYNAALCFAHGGAYATALVRHAELMRRYPRSPLFDRSFTRAWRLLIRRA